MDAAMAAAAHDQLGGLVSTLPMRHGNSFRRTAGQFVHSFEHGLVVDTKSGPLALPYRVLRIYRETVAHTQQEGFSETTQFTVTHWRFERNDGTLTFSPAGAVMNDPDTRVELP